MADTYGQFKYIGKEPLAFGNRSIKPGEIVEGVTTIGDNMKTVGVHEFSISLWHAADPQAFVAASKEEVSEWLGDSSLPVAAEGQKVCGIDPGPYRIDPVTGKWVRY